MSIADILRELFPRVLAEMVAGYAEMTICEMIRALMYLNGEPDILVDAPGGPSIYCCVFSSTSSSTIHWKHGQLYLRISPWIDKPLIETDDELCRSIPVKIRDEISKMFWANPLWL